MDIIVKNDKRELHLMIKRNDLAWIATYKLDGEIESIIRSYTTRPEFSIKPFAEGFFLWHLNSNNTMTYYVIFNESDSRFKCSRGHLRRFTIVIDDPHNLQEIYPVIIIQAGMTYHLIIIGRCSGSSEYNYLTVRTYNLISNPMDGPIMRYMIHQSSLSDICHDITATYTAGTQDSSSITWRISIGWIERGISHLKNIYYSSSQSKLEMGRLFTLINCKSGLVFEEIDGNLSVEYTNNSFQNYQTIFDFKGNMLVAPKLIDR